MWVGLWHVPLCQSFMVIRFGYEKKWSQELLQIDHAYRYLCMKLPEPLSDRVSAVDIYWKSASGMQPYLYHR